MPDVLEIDFDRPIPLFPLQHCVLLPHATVPLHIFEQRYRAMVGQALDGRGLIAMAVFNGDDWQLEYAGDPPVRPHVCLGYIVRHHRMADGRYNILLQGLCRARIEHELDHDESGYRRARLDRVEPVSTMEIDLEDQRARLEALLHDEDLKQLAAVSAIHNWLSRELPTPALADLSTLALTSDSEHRYAMLAEPDARQRLDWLIRYLEGTRRTVRLARRQEPAVSEEGWPLN